MNIEAMATHSERSENLKILEPEIREKIFWVSQNDAS
jgi:hypothetical protein